MPLDAIASGCSTHDKYTVLAPGSNTKIGTIEGKIDVMDLEPLRQENMSNIVRAA